MAFGVEVMKSGAMHLKGPFLFFRRATKQKSDGLSMFFLLCGA